MPPWASFIVMFLLFGVVVPAHAGFMYAILLKCGVKGCWRHQTTAFRDGYFVCGKHEKA
jgi:hypothetical protein